MGASMISKELAAANYSECLRLVAEGKVEAAKLLLAPLHAFFPDEVGVLNLLGMARLRTGDQAGALDALRQARRLRPDLVEVATNYAGCLIELGRASEAEPLLRELLAARSDNLVAAYLLASVLIDQQDHAPALALLERVVVANRRLADAWSKRGRALLGLGRNEEALSSFQVALDLDVMHAEANAGLARALDALPVSHQARLLVRGGVGDFLQSLPFLLSQHPRPPRLVVVSHFAGAASFFERLGIEVSALLDFSDLPQLQARRAELDRMAGVHPCPRQFYFDRPPFPPAEPLAFSRSLPALAMQLAGSSFSDGLQRMGGLVPKQLPPLLLERVLALDRFNVILFGAPAEIEALGMAEREDLRFACFPNVVDSLRVAAQCAAFVGSDSAVKSMAAMSRIPSVVWVGDYPDAFRDGVFIDPYVRDGVMAVFRYRDPVAQMQQGIDFTMAALEKFDARRG
jgi:tetratricopeptide (TPR) repeat protein